MASMWGATPPGPCWISLNGMRATLRGLACTMWTSGTKTNPDTPKLLCSFTNASSAPMVFPIRERWDSIWLCEFMISWSQFELIYFFKSHRLRIGGGKQLRHVLLATSFLLLVSASITSHYLSLDQKLAGVNKDYDLNQKLNVHNMY